MSGNFEDPLQAFLSANLSSDQYNHSFPSITATATSQTSPTSSPISYVNNKSDDPFSFNSSSTTPTATSILPSSPFVLSSFNHPHSTPQTIIDIKQDYVQPNLSSATSPTHSFTVASTNSNLTPTPIPTSVPPLTSTAPLASISLSESPLQIITSQQPLQVRNSAPDYSSRQSSESSAPPRRRPRAPREPAQPALPAPIAPRLIRPLEQVSSLSRGSYGSFSAPTCPWQVTRILLPILLILNLTVTIVYGVANQPCNGDVGQGHGYCGLSSFTRTLSIATFAFHTAMMAWFIQLYHTPLFTWFPTRSRLCIMFFFFIRSGFLITVWMLYFLILSLNLISSLPEQIEHTETAGDRALFYPPDVLGVIVCLFVKVMLGLMGKKIWKYWELRHLTPAELLHYEEVLEEGRHYGLSKEQFAVLTKITLTCTNGTTNMEDCPVCGHSSVYRPPSIVNALVRSVSPSVALNVVRQAFQKREDQTVTQVELLDFKDLNNLPRQPVQSNNHSSNGNESLLPPSSSLSTVNRSTSEQKSQATLVPHGGLPTMTCGICLEDYLIHARVMILPCRHHGHVECLQGWLDGHRTCPMCRARIFKDRA